METQSTRTGLAATAAVHVALAALLLAGWQVTRPRPVPKPIIVRPIPAPVDRAETVQPPTTEQKISIDLSQPVWDEAQPDPVVTPPVGDGVPQGPAAGTGTTQQPPIQPPPTAGPTRGARLIAATAMQPPYPSASRALGEEGSVELMISIDDRGAVTGVNLLRSSGFARLDAAAIAFALKRWRFEAALKDGQPVATSRRFTIRFNLASAG